MLLPDGYDGYDGGTEYPVLYLLHGAGEGHASWALPAKGDILETARGLDAIVVMPDGGRGGFYTNWWNGGLRGDPGWERYHLDELIPLVEERFRVRDGRRWHAIAGFSMGGFGTAFYATQRPGYFGAAVPMSALVSIRRPQVLLGLETISGTHYEQLWGPITGAYAEGHDPTALAESLSHTRLYVATGNGVPRPGVPAAAPDDVARFARKGRRLAATGSGTVTVHGGPGCSFTAALPFERACGD